jgi:hypothetical protein
MPAGREWGISRFMLFQSQIYVLIGSYWLLVR